MARASDVNPGPVAIQLLGNNYAIWQSGEGEFTAVADRCPHREAPLSAGCVSDGRLACAYHGWVFASGGVCVRVPSAEPELPVPPRAHMPAYGLEERYGLLWLRPKIADAGGAGEAGAMGRAGETQAAGAASEETKSIPKIPYIRQEDDSSYRRINTPVDIWQTSSPRLADNFMDFSHFPFVHAATFGNPEETVIPKLELGPLEDDFYGYRYGVNANNPASASATSGEATDIVEREMTTGFQLPFVVRSTIHYRSGLNHILLLLTTPRDDLSSYFTFVVWRNDDFSAPADEIISFDLAIGAEDKAMLEKVGGTLPLDLKETVNVQADKPSVEWRRQFAKLLESGLSS